jgi:hypothetical protein
MTAQDAFKSGFMNLNSQGPPVTICVLVYGDYPRLAQRCLESIFTHCERSLYRLVVGVNRGGVKTVRYLEGLHERGAIDRLILSPINLHKCPMMRRMFEGISTEFIWWFDDDSYVTDPRALPERLNRARIASADVVMWGQEMFCPHSRGFWEEGDAITFVRTALWYRGLPPPFWEPGGKGEFNFQGCGTGDGNWIFVPGGCWWIRTRAVHELDWPDQRLVILGDDVFLGEAVRQQGWRIENVGQLGIVTSAAERRWRLEDSLPQI